MSAAGVQKLEDLLADERRRLKTARGNAESADRVAGMATPGGLHDYDPAILSGIRRRPNRKADSRRFAAYDRASTASAALTEQERRVRVAERRLERAKRDAVAPCDLAAMKPGWLVRDRQGWHRVVRVSAKSVSVETAWSWTDRIPYDRIVETRSPSSQDERTPDA